MHTQLAVAVVALLAVRLPQDADAQWRVSRSTNPLDDSTTVVAVLDAAQGAGGLFRNEPVRLIARCRSNRTEAYIVWHDYLGLDDQRVTYRFPPAQARTETWGLSTDNDSTFVRRAIPFLRTAAENTRLVVQTTPYSESPTTAIFNLAGASDALAQIAETCEWTLDREQAQRERAARQRAQAQRERAVREQREQAERAERARRVAGANPRANEQISNQDSTEGRRLLTSSISTSKSSDVRFTSFAVRRNSGTRGTSRMYVARSGSVLSARRNSRSGSPPSSVASRFTSSGFGGRSLPRSMRLRYAGEMPRRSAATRKPSFWASRISRIVPPKLFAILCVTSPRMRDLSANALTVA